MTKCGGMKWEMIRLGDICCLSKKRHNGSLLPFLGMEHIDSGTGQLASEITPLVVKSSTFYFNGTHLLYGRLRPYLNKIFLPDFEGHCSTEIFPIECGPKLNRIFLFYWLTSETTVAAIDRTSTGARMPRANVNALLDFIIPLPPLPAQKRIVAILDEAFAAIATATANTKENIANAQELFDSELNRVFQPPQSAEDSVSDVTVDWHLLGDLINIQSGYAFNSKKYTDVGHFLVRIGNVQDGYLSLDRPKYVSLDSKTQRFSLNEGDFLTSLTGNIGRVARMDKLHLPAALNQRVARLTVNDVSMLLEDYLYYFLTSSLFRTALSTSGRGAAQQNVSPATINEIAIPLPSLPEQKRIARFLDKLSAEKQTLVETYKTKIHSLAELKQSLLHQAFTGELTADKNTTKRTLANTRI